MKKTARVIITSKCDRKCPGCCNSKLDYTSLAKVIGGITALKDYEEVVITGGEPMINPAQLYTVIKMLRKQNKRQKIYGMGSYAIWHTEINTIFPVCSQIQTETKCDLRDTR